MEQFEFSLDLIVTYVINFAYVMLRALTFAISCWAAFFLFDKLTKIDLISEIKENKNIGAAIVMGSIFWGLAYVIGQI
ncbi:MAG: DUF350 domain-containing protein [bacterium]